MTQKRLRKRGNTTYVRECVKTQSRSVREYLGGGTERQICASEENEMNMKKSRKPA